MMTENNEQCMMRAVDAIATLRVDASPDRNFVIDYVEDMLNGLYSQACVWQKPETFVPGDGSEQVLLYGTDGDIYLYHRMCVSKTDDGKLSVAYVHDIRFVAWREIPKLYFGFGKPVN